MTGARFDELIHPSTRLSIVGLLAAADWVEFAFLRDQLGLSDSALSKHLSRRSTRPGMSPSSAPWPTAGAAFAPA
jgi:DNA-binding transcriptional ArsR family regulator